MKLISCAVWGLIVGCTQGYIGLEIEVDGTVHLLHLDPCFAEAAVEEAVDVFVSSEENGLQKVEEGSCPVERPNCVRNEVLSAALKAHEANLSACGVGVDRAKSVPAAVAIASIDADFCTTIIMRHGEVLESAVPTGPLPPTRGLWKKEKRATQAAVMRYGQDFVRSLSAQERVLVELLRCEMRALPESQNGDWWPCVATTVRNIVLEFDPRYWRRWVFLHGIMDATNTIKLPVHDLFSATPDIDEVTEAGGMLQKQYADIVSAVNSRPENHRYEVLAREDSLQPGAPVVFKASKLSSDQTYSASSLGYAYLLLMFEGLLNQRDFRVEDSDVIVEFGAGTGLFPKLLRSNLGFSKDYVAWDLGVFSNMQTFHLRSAGYDVVRDSDEWRQANAFKPSVSPTLCATKAEDVMAVAAHTGGGGKQLKKVFIATWSLSEAPLGVRSMVEKSIIDGSFTHVFIAYQKKFFDGFGSESFVDNTLFFGGLSARLEAALGMSFHQIELEGGLNVLLVGEAEIEKRN
mmetsp:Transcript_7927/g.14327  ORF Transcript_7927/g.14327 Transcript_7927/m.14327 type:complete len:518 (-) Transcript_7927:27-1580(-)|eukprot:CAMPEP_0182496826 /NCGR_PEP_ID=MMETSP1321-20130603/5400_1 /TAXON_ID=91990 /ORGANISM="Bolidomonas sp., Strain RCC1657" /LENGTH=517 /DNA_ID=CAMNT_0024700527 /DNA_START=141 /DNA_END=1694 /DNA_ORIENTATION=-